MYSITGKIIDSIKKKHIKNELSREDIDWLIEQAEIIAECEAHGIPELGGSMYVTEVLKLVEENRKYRRLLQEISDQIRVELHK